jgi:hypothetical protein
VYILCFKRVACEVDVARDNLCNLGNMKSYTLSHF